jgi:hypothetical protein
MTKPTLPRPTHPTNSRENAHVRPCRAATSRRRDADRPTELLERPDDLACRNDSARCPTARPDDLHRKQELVAQGSPPGRRGRLPDVGTMRRSDGVARYKNDPAARDRTDCVRGTEASETRGYDTLRSPSVPHALTDRGATAPQPPGLSTVGQGLNSGSDRKRGRLRRIDA